MNRKRMYLFRIVAAFALMTASAAAETLYNGIVLPSQWPPLRTATQEYEVPSYITSPPAVIPIDVGRQLFVDDFLIEQTTLRRTAHRPVMYSGNPVLSPGGPDVNNSAFPYSDGVWYDPSDRLFKMWYYGDNGAFISYATSTDGVNWTKPSVASGTNKVLQIGGGRDSATVWMDLEDSNPARRFKAFAYYPPNYIWVFFSPDGIRWSSLQPYSITTVSDRTTMFWNPFRKVWVESERRRVRLPATTTRVSYVSRARLYAESRDLATWKPSNFVDSFWTGPDEQDPPYVAGGALPELYNLDAVGYESLMVGLFSFWHPGPSYDSSYGAGPNLVELNVGFSRDGFNWVRPTRGSGNSAFIPASNTAGSWNGNNTQSAGGCFLVVGDELWFYFSARSLPKPSTGVGSTGLAKLRRDGFYSMDAGGSEGTLTTRTVRFAGSRMFVNVNNPGGQLQVEALDAGGNVISPFTRANSIPLSVNKTAQEVRWNGASSLASLAGRNVKFRFYLTNGSLYSFWVTPHAAGASYGYVAAGGPGFTRNIDDGGVPVTVPPPPPPPPTGTAAFVRVDSGTRGNWKTLYGADGFNVAASTQAYPSYATVTPTGQTPYTWQSSTTDVRALQKPTGTGRIAGVWYNWTTFTVDLNLTDQKTHQVAAYFLDWDSRNRNERVEVLDVNGRVLDTRSIANFTGGVYLVWNLSGRVRLRVTNTGGYSAVMSGLFFGGGGPGGATATANSAASFVGVDTATGGSWRSVYGNEGYQIVNSSMSYPSYVTVNFSGAIPYTWVAPTTDSRALQNPLGSDRIASTWYNVDSFVIDLNFTDSQVHRVALYGLDWDALGRGLRFDVLDASDAVLDTRTLSNFTGGAYLVWNLAGHVKVRVTRVAGLNAVVSALFFG